MDRPTKRRLLWLGGGLVLYLLGGVLFLVVVMRGISPSGGFDMEAIAAGPGLALLLASTVLFALGGFCMRKGRSIGPADGSAFDAWTGHGPLPGRSSGGDPSDRGGLPEQFNIPPESEAPDERPGGDRNREGNVIVCPTCRAENEASFTFCWNCSEEL